MKWWLDDLMGHPVRTAYWSVRIAQRLGWSWLSGLCLFLGALLHDIGKLRLPARLLHKPGHLESHEREVMRRHTQCAYAWLSFTPGTVRRVIRCHHESWDGSGYPHALKDSQIPLCARIVAVADVYDALTSPRPYKAAWRPEQAVAHILAARGRQFDPRIVTVFVALVRERLARAGRLPVGELSC